MRIFAMLLGFLCLQVSVWAQVSGLVTDAQGGVIEGAQLTLRDLDRGLERVTRSTAAGLFLFDLTPPGTYRLEARRDGFEPAVRERFRVNINDQLNLRFELQVAGRADMVTVSAAADLIGDSPVVRTLVDRQFISNQPLNGRSLQSLIGLTPGVTMTGASLPTPGQFSVNGQRASSNAFMVDGVSANFGTSASVTPYEPIGGTVPALSALGSTASLASLEALEEFSIQTSTYAPEFGRQPGAQVSLVTRSGSNEWHGSLFHFFRNDKLDANDWFANANGLPRQALRQNDFGGTFGGPIRRNRTFFFASHESMLVRSPFVTPPLEVPSILAREQATGVLRDLLNAFPLPAAAPFAGNPLSTPYIATVSNPASLIATSLRVDHALSDRWTAFGRFNIAPSDNRERGKWCATSCISVTDVDVDTWTGGLMGNLAPGLTADLRVNFSRSTTRLYYEMDNYGGAVVPPLSSLYPSFTDGSKGYIYIELDPGGANTLSDGLFAENRQRQAQAAGTIGWFTGRHNFRFGYDYRRLTPQSDSGSYRRQFRFTSVAQLAGGIAPSAAIIAPDIIFEPTFENHSAFIQDTWRATPRLTLTYGARWEIVPSPGERNGNHPRTVLNLDQPERLEIAPRGSNFYQTQWTNWAPRAGFAYRLNDSGSWVLRGGWGLFYDLGYGFLGNAYNTSLWPYARQTGLSNIAYTAPGAAIQPPAVSEAPPYSRLFAFENGFSLPRIQQWNVAVEHALTRHDTLSLSWVGASGRRLGRLEQIRNLRPGFTRIDAIRSNAESAYQGLQAQYQRRMARGVQALVNCTLGESTDTASEESISNFYAPAARINPEHDRGPSSFDIRHQMNAALSWQTPRRWGGFSLDGIFRARGATPIDIRTGRDPFGIGYTTVSRPDLVPGVPLYLDDPNTAAGRRFNRAAFDDATPVAQGRQGTLDRNALRGFGAWQTDLSLRRRFQLAETLALEAQADAFNLLNRPSFGNPNGILTAANFGYSTRMLGSALGGLSPLFQMGGPRSLQLALRLRF